MNLIRTSILTSCSTAVRVLSGFIINKTIAVYSGPSGLALFAQLQNFNSLATTFAKAGISRGVVKYIAGCDSCSERSMIVNTSILITSICSIIVGLVVFIYSENLAESVLKRIELGYVFKIFSITLLLFALNSIFLSIINGIKQIKTFTIINVLSSVITLTITLILVSEIGIDGALVSIVLNQSFVFFITFIIMIKNKWIKFKSFTGYLSKKYLFRLFSFSLMTVVTAAALPLSHFFVRDHISNVLSIEKSGIWQGMLFISNTYLMFIITALGVYYTPKLSGIKKYNEAITEIKNGYLQIIPVIVFISFFIYLLRDYIITFAFDERFIGMSELFAFFLIGDIFKICSFILSSIMVAKALTKLYIYTEVLFTISYVILNYFLIIEYGILGSSYAHFINYLFYLLFMVLYFFNNLHKVVHR